MMCLDKLKWKETRDDVYSVKSMYKALRPRITESFPWNLAWKSCVAEDLLHKVSSLVRNQKNYTPLNIAGFIDWVGCK